jgi:hypothetical protein
MPIHDWTLVDAGLFHDFHQDWTIELRQSLNAGLLQKGLTARVLQDGAFQAGSSIPPLEETYRNSWAVFPADLKPLLEPGTK